MIFNIKQYNEVLVTIKYIDEGIKGQSIEVLKVNESKKHLLPIGIILESDGIKRWLKQRVNHKNRENMENLLSQLGLSRNNVIDIIKVSRGLSLTDSYWIVEEGFEGKFEDFNLFENEFEKTLALLAYTGYGSVKAKGFTSSPEFTTNGMLKKAWRIKSGKRYLYKGGTSGAVNTGKEPYSEYYASQIAKALEINHVEYDLAKWKKGIVSTCELFTTINTSYVPIYSYVGNKSIYEVSEFLRSLGDEIHDEFVNMIIFDSVICNEDRHYGNFGLLVDSKTNNPISFAPIFDNGISLFNYAMPSDFLDLDKYSKTRMSSYNIPFLELSKEFITKKQKVKLRKLLDFEFEKHASYNLENKKIKAIEKFIKQRAEELIEI